MRRRLALVFVALAVMLAVGFLVPLGRSVKSQAELRTLTGAQSDARGAATALAAVVSTTGRSPSLEDAAYIVGSFETENIVILLPDGMKIGRGVPDLDLQSLSKEGSIIADVEGGVIAVVPIDFDDNSPAVVATYVKDSDLREGVATSWLILAALGLIVVIGSVPIADRLAASLIKPVKGLSNAALKWAGGDLSARVEPSGPREIAESGQAFNLLAERLTELLAAERERVADLSHRLRTPLAALRLQAESTKDPEHRSALVADIASLEGEVTALIEDLRKLPDEQSTIADLTTVVERRMGFWRIVAAAQDRELSVITTSEEPILVASPDSEVLTALDNLVQNVLAHTPEGTGFSVSVLDKPPSLIVNDEGEGLSSPDVFDRGSTTGESSGIGLDIVRKIAEASGGEVRIGEGPGANIIVRFGKPNDN
jgi:signal transduction histidine kinase